MLEVSDFVIPGANAMTLGAELAASIKERFSKDRDNRFQIYTTAAGLRKQHLDPATKAYSNEFVAWYDRNGMKKLFGEMSASFSRYAAAGELVDWVATYQDPIETETHKEHGKLLPENYLQDCRLKRLEMLPVGRSALYELYLILKQEGEQVFSLLFSFNVSRTRSDQTEPEQWAKDGDPFINPLLSESQARSWRVRWQSPPQPKQKRTDKRTLVLGVITAHGSLFDFDKKTGEKTPDSLDLDQVLEFERKLNALFPDPDNNPFKFIPNMEYLTNGYNHRKEQASLTQQTKEAIAVAKAPKHKAKKSKPDRKKVDQAMSAIDVSNLNGLATAKPKGKGKKARDTKAMKLGSAMGAIR